MTNRVGLVASVASIVLAIALAPAASAAKGAGGGKPGACTRKAPGVVVDNNWAWGQPGSWGLPGQQRTYAIDVINYDAGCGSSTFAVGLAAPQGFSSSLATSSISLKSGSSGYVLATVTSPGFAAAGDYPLTVTVQRSGQTASATSWYKVYLSDSAAPTLYWPSPGDGATITGRSYTVGVSSTDDHAVKTIELHFDNALVATTACDDISYTCQLNYSWSTTRGQHTATFRSYDWLGNVGVLTETFTVS